MTSDDNANGNNNDNPCDKITEPKMNDIDDHQDDDHQDDEQRQKNGNDMAKCQQLATTRQNNIKWQ